MGRTLMITTEIKNMSYSFSVLLQNFVIARLEPNADLPRAVLASPGFLSITRTADELSIVCAEDVEVDEGRLVVLVTQETLEGAEGVAEDRRVDVAATAFREASDIVLDLHAVVMPTQERAEHVDREGVPEGMRRHLDTRSLG